MRGRGAGRSSRWKGRRFVMTCTDHGMPWERRWMGERNSARVSFPFVLGPGVQTSEHTRRV